MPPSHPAASGLTLVVQLFWWMARGFAQPRFSQDQTQDPTAAVLPPDRCSPQSSDSRQSLAAIPFYLNKCASPCRNEFEVLQSCVGKPAGGETRYLTFMRSSNRRL